jgi:hypothetical protein
MVGVTPYRSPVYAACKIMWLIWINTDISSRSSVYIYQLDSEIRRIMTWAGNVARMMKKGDVYRLLLGKPKGKRPLGRPRCRWVDNIKMDLEEI